MRNFTFGFLLGSFLTGTLSLAGTFYDSKGQPAAPRGSIQQYDYFRQRQLYLDIGAMRDQADRNAAKNPCSK